MTKAIIMRMKTMKITIRMNNKMRIIHKKYNHKRNSSCGYIYFIFLRLSTDARTKSSPSLKNLCIAVAIRYIYLTMTGLQIPSSIVYLGLS